MCADDIVSRMQMPSLEANGLIRLLSDRRRQGARYRSPLGNGAARSSVVNYMTSSRPAPGYKDGNGDNVGISLNEILRRRRRAAPYGI